MEWNIGEIKQVKGEWYQCVRGEICADCAFTKKHCNENPLFEAIDSCSKYFRKDATSVIFKKLEKVGEPIEFARGLYFQRYQLADSTAFYEGDTRLFFNAPTKTFVYIEIKTKEDMEEKNNAKHSNSEKIGKNLKEFDLEAAKQGKPVCTRNGRKARIICFDRKFYHDGYNYPIVAMVNDNDNELVHAYTQDGLLVGNMKGDLDLMMLPEKKEGWVNVYKDSVYDTKDEALIGRSESRGYIDTEITDYKPYVDWEKRKYDIAKEAMLKMIDPNAKTQNYGVMAINAVEIAIHLIDKLKRVK